MWRNFEGTQLSEDILKEVESTLQRESAAGNSLKVCIGTDSQVKGNWTEYATVIVFVRQKKGGFMFINQEKRRNLNSVKERMITEVAMSVDIAYRLCDLLDRYHVELEVHADINTNPHFESNSALKEATGYILGMGFCFKAKPEAFASSYCADRMVN
ncbi:MAG: ribonuclease H-like YkuK family protein [Bacteroidota bacterium]|nr:ribonuclease H-like YkuK family protein [Bacteroidota bacterium]MDX5430395.1 ribonuclease H-like YkuK family protein [Bacteroidota bacterium]MDX5469154.1 ribonuclease H-like YkuK family protein [Bacteroidota bacterium]